MSAQEQAAELGPYRLISELGRGGMGIVYHGVHSVSGREVAIKTAITADRRAMSAIRTEVLALKRISHPSVVQVLDEGVSKGVPWYAMELIRGDTLETWNSTLWGQSQSVVSGLRRVVASEVHPLRAANSSSSERRDRPPAANGRLTEALILYQRIAIALGHLHARGVIHCDLKPNNVFVRPDATPVLVDFGLVSRGLGEVARESIAAGDPPLGTVLYAAPEQILGEFVDARADLYALGCMLFETLTGQPLPHAVVGFRRGDSLETRGITKFVDAPAALDALVRRLLAVSVKDRLSAADDVAADLAHLAGSAAEASEPPASVGAMVPLFRPKIVGRDGPLERLADCRKRAINGNGSISFIGGESGIGKTFLAMEAVRSAAIAQFQIVTSECKPAAVLDGDGPEIAGAPLHAFRDLLQMMADRCHEKGEAYALYLFGGQSRVLAEYEPSLVHLPSASEEPTPPALAPEHARRRLLSTITEAIARLADDGPLLLVFDDLQWADELSINVLAALTPELLGSRPLWIVGTYRIEEISDALRGILARPDVVSIELGPLDEPMVHRVASDMLGTTEVPPDFGRFLFHRSDGNPFVIAECLRAAATEGVLTRRFGRWHLNDGDPSDGYESLALPGSVREIVELRFRGLGGSARRAIDAASVLGREFDLETFRLALAADEPTALNLLEPLRRAQIIEVLSVDKIRFVHDRIRECAYAQISTDERTSLHQNAARAIETRYRSDDEIFAHFATLASHWSMGRAPDKAYAYFKEAAERARAAFANADAIRYFSAAISEAAAMASRDAASGHWHHELATSYEEIADLQTRIGHHDRARESYELASSQLAEDEIFARARLFRKIGKSHEFRHRYDTALATLKSAEDTLRESAISPDTKGEWTREWIDIQNQKIWVFYWTAQLAEMECTIADTRAPVDEFGSAAQRAQFYQLFSLLRMRRERYQLSDETVTLARLAYEAIQHAGPLESPAVHFTFAFALLFNDHAESAEVELRLSLAGAERAGDVAVQARVITYLLVALRRRGDIAETPVLAKRVLALASSSQMLHYVGAARASLGWVAYRGRDYELAERECRSAITAWDAAMPSAFPFRWMALWPLLGIQLNKRTAIERELVVALLDPSQQQLPGDLPQILQRVSEEPSEGLKARVLAALSIAAQHGQV